MARDFDRGARRSQGGENGARADDALPRGAGKGRARAVIDGHVLTELLTVAEVAELLRLTPKGVYALVESRRIPFIRVSNRVRFLLSDVLAWLRENRVPASEDR